MECKHENSYHFHDNAPKYCPDCDNYIDGNKILGKSKNEL